MPATARDKSGQDVAGIGGEHLSAGMRGDHEHRGGLDFERVFAPDFALQGHASVKVRQFMTIANNHRRSVHG
jgi:hypothetical protein